MYYDGNGNPIDLGGSSKTIITTVLGAELPEDMSNFPDVTSEYAAAMKSAIVQWGTDYAGDAQKIPFIIHTDQHGRLNPNNKNVFDLLAYLVNWDSVSAIFNLGDTVVDHWEDDDTNPDPLLRNAQLENALSCVEAIPADKQINVWGNHDTWYNGSLPTQATSVMPDLKYLNPYFKATGLRTIRCPDNSGLMEVFDDVNLVRYLVVANWDYTARSQADNNYFYVSADHWRWIIAKMTENTGYDLVVVSHVPIMCGSSIAINPITEESAQRSTLIRLITQTSGFDAIWRDRKTKSAGSITSQGQTIDYDFQGCTDKLLCALAGHMHNDAVDYCGGATGMLCATFDWFADRTIHFGLIDRRNNQVKVWKLHNEDSTPGVQTWTAPFDYAGA